MKKLLLQLRIWLLRIARPDKIMYIGGSDTLPQPLSRTEEAQLIAQMDQGDFSVRQTLIERNLQLATYASRCIENEILMFLRKNSAQRTEISFDEPLSTDWDGKELLLSDVLGTDGDTVMRPIEADVDRKLLQDAVGKLSSREQDIITLRFGLGGKKEMTQKEVADHMGISQSYISRLEKRIILRLRREILKMS